MRIVGGKFRHRLIKETNLETTRETQDKVREAIFNSLGQYFNGGIVLDLFCGSGALAIEAYSRGIDKIYLNDLNKMALKVAKSNLDSLGIKDYRLYNKNYKDCLEDLNIKFDYIFLDPPYAMTDIEDILKRVSLVCKNQTIIIFEMAVTTKAREVEGFILKKEKLYGRKKVVYYEYLTSI